MITGMQEIPKEGSKLKHTSKDKPSERGTNVSPTCKRLVKEDACRLKVALHSSCILSIIDRRPLHVSGLSAHGHHISSLREAAVEPFGANGGQGVRNMLGAKYQPGALSTQSDDVPDTRCDDRATTGRTL